jgi:hypothetical protein
MELRDTVDAESDPAVEKESGVGKGNDTADVEPDPTVEKESGIGKVNDI